MFSLREGAVKGFSVSVTHAADAPVLFSYEKKKTKKKTLDFSQQST